MMTYKELKKSFAAVPNYIRIPVYQTRDPEEYNAILNELRNHTQIEEKKIKRTISKGICVDRAVLWHEMPCFEATTKRYGAEILVLSYEFGHCRIQFRPSGNKTEEENNTVHGRTAFAQFKRDCKRIGIDLESYMVNEDVGYEIKKTIEAPYIDVFNQMLLNKIFTNVHHLDINSSYPAGLAESHPEFYPLIKRYYDNRRQNKDYKAILNLTIGFMQSTYCDYRYSELSRDAIAVNNRKVEQMTEWLQDHGRSVIAWNTDGIWFAGESCKDIFNSTELGEWHEDYSNCQFRMKSKGAYEFLCEGKYYAKVRGKTKYEEEKPRDQWEWGDIYREAAEHIIKYMIDEQGYAREITNG